MDVTELMRIYSAPWVLEVCTSVTETEGRMAAKEFGDRKAKRDFLGICGDSSESEVRTAVRDIKDCKDVKGGLEQLGQLNTGVRRVLAVSMAG